MAESEEERLRRIYGAARDRDPQSAIREDEFGMDPREFHQEPERMSQEYQRSPYGDVMSSGQEPQSYGDPYQPTFLEEPEQRYTRDLNYMPTSHEGGRESGVTVPYGEQMRRGPQDDEIDYLRRIYDASREGEFF
jgi:hypothetical protein